MNFNFDKEFTALMTTHQLTTVIILGHLNPDGDCCGSVLGLSHYIHHTYPEFQVIPYMASNMDHGPKACADTDLIFHPFEKPANQLPDRYAAIVCDTATTKRLVGIEYFDRATATIVLDHHAVNEGYGTINNTTISEACAENVYHMVDLTNLKAASAQPHPNAADYLYLGIIHDTCCFDRANPDLLLAASTLLSLGVNHREIVQTRKTKTLADKRKEAWLLDHSSRACNGEVGYVFLTREDALIHHIEYEDIHPISEVLRDCADIQMAFTMFEESPDLWRCSFRSDGIWMNVNELLLPLGGGGHAGASGLRQQTTDPEGLLKKILDRIEELRQNR